MKKKLYTLLTKLSLLLHNLAYKLSGRFAVKAEGGLHPKHRLMKYHQFFVDKIENEETVLDIGCGNGALSYDIAKKTKKVIAIDMSEDNIKAARAG